MPSFRAYAARCVLATAGFALGLGLPACSRQADVHGESQQEQQDEIECDVVSKYSHFKVTREYNTRTLWFVRDSGEEVVESQVDLNHPWNLLVEYTRFMFMSYLFRPAPERVLIVGLGGGSMVHFLNHYDRKVKIDVIEIDEVIVKAAKRYFGIREGGNLKIMVRDGFEYLTKAEARYDVIFMDAFLKPSGQTDDTGVPMRLKTLEFYRQIQKRLTPDGVVVFNLNPHAGQDEDVKTIRQAFPNIYVFQLRFNGLVVVASMSPERVPGSALAKAAAQLDRRFHASYSYRDMLTRMIE